ncbi:MAG: 5'-methylthioadenosine/adenosylhomocysteine nucleosidase [Bacteroidota bacterium]|nr:5'-methylthioadenosine/adenosylhomocysteine nucleosidase [Bacteroidota bacterium]
MKIGLIVAMQKEMKAIASLLEHKQEINTPIYRYVTGQIGNNEIILMQCGIGKVNAAMGTENMINTFSPELILSTGVAGGTDNSMELMDAVVSSQLAYHDVFCGEENLFGQVQGMPARFEADEKLVAVAKKLKYKHKVNCGLMLTGDWFVTKKEKILEILSLFPEAMAVDMESTAIAQVCYIRKIPFCALRIISDIPTKGNSTTQYKDFWNTLADNSFELTKQFIENL